MKHTFRPRCCCSVCPSSSSRSGQRLSLAWRCSREEEAPEQPQRMRATTFMIILCNVVQVPLPNSVASSCLSREHVAVVRVGGREQGVGLASAAGRTALVVFCFSFHFFHFF